MSVINDIHGPERPFATYEKAVPGGPTIIVTQWVDTAELRDLELVWAGRNRVRLDRRDIGELLCALLAANEDEVRELSLDYWERKEAAQEAEYARERELAELERERAEPTEQYLIDRAIHDDHAEGNEEPDYGFDERWELEEDQPPFELTSFGGRGGEL
jgi:hypothetical protein